MKTRIFKVTYNQGESEGIILIRVIDNLAIESIVKKIDEACLEKYRSERFSISEINENQVLVKDLSLEELKTYLRLGI